MNDLYLDVLRAPYKGAAPAGRAYLRRFTLDLQAPDGEAGRGAAACAPSLCTRALGLFRPCPSRSRLLLSSFHSCRWLARHVGAPGGRGGQPTL